ncbi:MAG: GIY-YIG nuclease family protein [Betaproteobacteria bacterium]|nr:GIY-YIG nuclease family protein [Betaproteobacteria bacterium]
MRNPRPWWLYLIECADGTLYAGIAVDVAARYARHAEGKGARYTRAHPPVRVAAMWAYPDRSAASKAEYRLKRLTAAQKRRIIAGEAPVPGCGRREPADRSAGR